MQPGAARGRQELRKEGDGLFSQSPVCSFSLLSVRRQVGLGAVTRGLSEQNPCHIHVADVARVRGERRRAPQELEPP